MKTQNDVFLHVLDHGCHFGWVTTDRSELISGMISEGLLIDREASEGQVSIKVPKRHISKMLAANIQRVETR